MARPSYPTLLVHLAAASVLTIPALGRPLTLQVDAAHPAGDVSPRLYGLMTEEINYAYDGGLYAETIRNRAFLDDSTQPAHWSVVASQSARVSAELDHREGPSPAIPVALRLAIKSLPPGELAGIANQGYWGIPLHPSTLYRVSFWAKGGPDFRGRISAALQNADGSASYASGEVGALTSQWRRYTLDLATAATTPVTTGRFRLAADQTGTVWFSLISVFPPTWKDRPNGLRVDLMQKLVDLHPKFLRFPGGNYLEGDTVATRFDWKKTIGPLQDRPGHQGPWGYRSTDGLGLLEFLEWCEDMGSEPVLAVYAGYSLKGETVPAGAALAPFVQDALDEIEYVAGDASTPWGARRVQDGHPAPFPLHFVEIGNEDNFDKHNTYNARFAQFVHAIKARHPDLECISTVPRNHPEQQAREPAPDVIDDHYYASRDKFFHMAVSEYDRLPRTGPKIFVGEWASHETSFPPWDKRSERESPTPAFAAALSDAAFMSELERNSDLVLMNCYAPLLVNVNPGARQWRPDLIGYDALSVYGSPSYYAFKMYSTHVGAERLRVSGDVFPLFASATRARTGEVYVKLVNPNPEAEDVTIDCGTASFRSARAITLSGDLGALNSIAAPERVAPQEGAATVSAGRSSYRLGANTVAVLTLIP